VHISPRVTYLYRFLEILTFCQSWPIQKWSVYGPTALPPELCTVQYLPLSFGLHSVEYKILYKFLTFYFIGQRIAVRA
jgi:hypothetical protein